MALLHCGKRAYERGVEGTDDAQPGDSAHWIPYIYKGLPVLTDRRPPLVAPYQLRLDWQMWFAAMSSADEYPGRFTWCGSCCTMTRAPWACLRAILSAQPPRISGRCCTVSLCAVGQCAASLVDTEQVGIWLSAMSAMIQR